MEVEGRYGSIEVIRKLVDLTKIDRPGSWLTPYMTEMTLKGEMEHQVLLKLMLSLIFKRLLTK